MLNKKRKSKWTNVSKHLKVRTTQNKNWNQRQIKRTQNLGEAASQALSLQAGKQNSQPGCVCLPHMGEGSRQYLQAHLMARVQHQWMGLKQRESSFENGCLWDTGQCGCAVCGRGNRWQRGKTVELWPSELLSLERQRGSSRLVTVAHLAECTARWLGHIGNNWQPARYIWLRLLRSSHEAFLDSWASSRLRTKCVCVLNKIFLIISADVKSFY